MKFVIELLFKTLIIFSVVNYAFIAFDNNIYDSLISNKITRNFLYLVIASIGIFMFSQKVLPDWIKAFHYIVKFFTK